MPFKEMDPELVLKAIEGYQNELEPAKNVQDAFYRQMECPRCHNTQLERHFVSIDHAFSGEDILPRSGLKCVLCDCIFDPHTGLILKLGNVGNVKERILPTLTPIVGSRK